jgi:hypothetical protein
LKAAIPAPELDDWYLLELVDPWGQFRDDLRIAKLTLSVASLLGVERQDKQPWSINDFLLKFDPDRTPEEVEQAADNQSPETMEFWFKVWASAANIRYRNREGVEES